MSIKSAAIQKGFDEFLTNIHLGLPLDVDDEVTYKVAVDFLDKTVNQIYFLKEYNSMQAVAIYEIFRMIMEDEKF